jgi:hypothetical protein
VYLFLNTKFKPWYTCFIAEVRSIPPATSASIEVERTVYQSTGKDGEDVVTITNVKRKKVEATKDVYRKYNFNIDYIIKQMNQDFSKTE